MIVDTAARNTENMRILFFSPLISSNLEIPFLPTDFNLITIPEIILSA